MLKQNKRQSVASGALLLAVSGFIAKLLGAFYRVPLTHIAGAEGMGLYQMVFPLYALLLTVSGSGMPSAIARLISQKNAQAQTREANQIFKSALMSLTVLGGIAMLAVFALSKTIASVQGNSSAQYAYRAIAPALLFSAMICAFRGYFQGRQNMTPSAISQLTEQIIKLCAGILFAVLLLPKGIEIAIMGALLGVSLSELVSLLILVLMYLRRREGCEQGESITKRQALKQLYALSLPITLGGLVLPISQLIDSVTVINILRASMDKATATSLYGLMGGTVGSLINLPVVLSLSIAIAVMPSISRLCTLNNSEGIKRKIGQAIKFCWLISLPSCIGLVAFATPIISLLYGGGLSGLEQQLASRLIAISAINVVYISFSQVFTNILQGLGRVYLPLICASVSAVIKTGLTIPLTYYFGIEGTAVASVIAFSVSAILGAIFIVRQYNFCLNFWSFLVAPLLSGGAMLAVGIISQALLLRLVGGNLALILAIFLAGAFYFIFLLFFRAVNAEELEGIKIPKKIKKILFKADNI